MSGESARAACQSVFYSVAPELSSPSTCGSRCAQIARALCWQKQSRARCFCLSHDHSPPPPALIYNIVFISRLSALPQRRVRLLHLSLKRLEILLWQVMYADIALLAAGCVRAAVRRVRERVDRAEVPLDGAELVVEDVVVEGRVEVTLRVSTSAERNGQRREAGRAHKVVNRGG